MAETTPTPAATVKKLPGLAIGLVIAGVSVFVLAFAIARGWKKGKS